MTRAELRLILLLASIPAPAVALSSDISAVELSPGCATYPITKAQVLLDPDGTLSIEDIRTLESRGAALWAATDRFNFGYSKARHWLKVPVSNRGANEDGWLMELGYPMIQVVEFHQYAGTRKLASYKTGRLLPFSSRPIRHHTFLFGFSVPKGVRTDLYLMVQSNGTLFAPLSISTKDAFLAQSVGKTMAIGIYVGIILAMVLYNLFLLLAFRDRNYLFYIVYAATFCLLLSSLNGMTYQYLWPDWPDWNKVSVPVLVGISYLFLALFTKSFLETRRLVPRLDMGLNALIAGALFLMVGGAFSYGLFVNRFTSLFVSVVPLIVIPISARCMQLESPFAVYYLVAFSCFFLGSATHAARDLAWLPHNFVTENGPYLGSTAEMLFLSLGLAARIKRLREENFRSELQVEQAHQELAKSREKLDRQFAISTLAAQVAHDIRSPLAALEIVSGDVSQLPEDKRILIRAAVGRIRDIANSLLSKQRAQAAGAAPEPPGAAAPQLLSSLIDPVVSEKRLQFRSHSRVEIELRLDASSYGLFAAVRPVEFKRLVSNLVNNAVESFADGPGAVSVSLSSRDGRALVSVQDDGKGIPPEVLAKLGRRGETHGKAGGSGLGLHHARTNAESWGGSLEIASEAGKGTTTTVVLPLAPAPEWFVPELRLTPGKAVVILDDDASIHQVWQGRLDSLKAGERGVEVVHVSTPEEIRAWVKGEPVRAPQALYLFDYELLGCPETGLSLAEELALGERVVLVTSRYEEPAVLEGCRRLKARLIPKGLAGSVPMRVEKEAETPERQRFDAVLIDDDPLTRMTWKMTASRLGKTLRAFATAAEFFEAAGEIDRQTPVYMDAELGDGVKGDVESLKIHELGFGEIYLATGHEAEKFAGLAHLRGVIGKEPPWSA